MTNETTRLPSIDNITEILPKINKFSVQNRKPMCIQCTNEIYDALKNPKFSLYLGRRSCPPSFPIVLGIKEELKLNPEVKMKSGYLKMIVKEKDISNEKVQLLLKTCYDTLLDITKDNKKYVRLEVKENVFNYYSTFCS